MTAKTQIQIQRALRALGASQYIRVLTMIPCGGDRVEVSINREYFGLWDVSKATFVD